jgi:CPA2 family monovalent cation:H+ antiporter-2
VFARTGGAGFASAATLPIIGLALLKVAIFAVLMLVVGTRTLPWILGRVDRLHSRELLLLCGLALALGIAFGAAELFGVSYALGAFLAGVVLNGSPLGHRVANQLLPFRDAFAVLFFVAVGMAFDPSTLVRQPLAMAATVAIVVVGKSIAAFLIVIALRQPARTGLRVAAALAQIGEFSFIVAAMAVALGVMPVEGQGLILGGALISIVINPLAFRVATSFAGKPPVATA